MSITASSNAFFRDRKGMYAIAKVVTVEKKYHVHSHIGDLEVDE
jgi:hypothetical protein